MKMKMSSNNDDPQQPQQQQQQLEMGNDFVSFFFFLFSFFAALFHHLLLLKIMLVGNVFVVAAEVHDERRADGQTDVAPPKTSLSLALQQPHFTSLVSSWP